MATLFTKLINGQIPSFKIFEDTECFAFMDIRPIAKGHVLVVPKKEIDYIFDLDDKLLAKLMAVSKIIAKAIEKVVPCQRVGIMVAGLEVPHAHIHLVPIQSIGDLTFANARPADPNELKELSKKIIEAL